MVFCAVTRRAKLLPMVESGWEGKQRGGEGSGDPGAAVGRGGDEGLRAGGEEGGGEDGAAVEREAEEGLVGGVDERRG